jgi:hypothetical protein
VDKLYGFSIMCDAYFGAAHIMAVAIRNAASGLGPALHALATYYGSPAQAMNMVNRVLFHFQQVVLRWLRKRRDTASGTAVPVPDFSDLVSDVQSYLLAGIPDLPATWHLLIHEENNTSSEPPDTSGTQRIRGGGDNREREVPANLTVTNSRVDPDIKRRWTATGFTRMAQMTDGYTGSGTVTAAIPKHANGKSACLKWCTGKCSANCARKECHKQIGAQMIMDLHGFMTSCGVATL